MFLGTPGPADGAVAATGEADALLRKPRSLIGTSQAAATRQPSAVGHVAPVKQQPAVHPAPTRRWDLGQGRKWGMKDGFRRQG